MYFMYDFIKCPKSFPLGAGSWGGGDPLKFCGGGGGGGGGGIGGGGGGGGGGGCW